MEVIDDIESDSTKAAKYAVENCGSHFVRRRI